MKIIAIKQYKGGNWTEAVTHVIDHNLVDLNIKNGAGIGSIVSKNLNSNAASGENSIAIGPLATNGNSNIKAFGKGSIAISGQGDYETKAEGDNSIAIGGNTSASGTNSIAFGSHPENETTAAAQGAIALGNGVTAEGVNSTAFGINTVASGDWSIAGGKQSIAAFDNAFAWGRSAQAECHTSFVIGNSCKAIKVGEDGNGDTLGANCAFVGGRRSIARGDANLVFGLENEGGASNTLILLGSKNKANVSHHSFVAGHLNWINVIGERNIVVGSENRLDTDINNTILSDTYSASINGASVFGTGLFVSKPGVFAIGRFNSGNEPDDCHFIIGDGIGNDNQRHTLMMGKSYLESGKFINSLDINAQTLALKSNKIKFLSHTTNADSALVEMSTTGNNLTTLEFKENGVNIESSENLKLTNKTGSINLVAAENINLNATKEIKIFGGNLTIEGFHDETNAENDWDVHLTGWRTMKKNGSIKEDKSTVLFGSPNLTLGGGTGSFNENVVSENWNSILLDNSGINLRYKKDNKIYNHNLLNQPMIRMVKSGEFSAKATWQTVFEFNYSFKSVYLVSLTCQFPQYDTHKLFYLYGVTPYNKGLSTIISHVYNGTDWYRGQVVNGSNSGLLQFCVNQDYLANTGYSSVQFNYSIFYIGDLPFEKLDRIK